MQSRRKENQNKVVSKSQVKIEYQAGIDQISDKCYIESRRRKFHNKFTRVFNKEIVNDLQKNSFSEILEINTACLVPEPMGLTTVLVLHLYCLPKRYGPRRNRKGGCQAFLRKAEKSRKMPKSIS